MYSNLLKRGMTYVTDEEKRVVDTNELIAQKLETYRQSNQNAGGFRAGLQAQELEIVPESELVSDGDIAALLGEEPVYEGPDPQELLAQAQEEIARMEEESRKRLEAERHAAMKQAKEDGYQQGFVEGQREGMAQTEAMRQELAEQSQALQAEYMQMIEELEPAMVDTLTGIYQHIFQVDLSGYRDLIFKLVVSSLNRIDGARDYLVHVSKEDFPYVNMQKKEILENCMMGSVNLEVIEDISLNRNECLIETEGGIYDCGLGTQLSELTRKLKLLSYEKE